MRAFLEILKRIGSFLWELIMRLAGALKKLLQRSGGTAIDTRKLIAAVCRTADECRVVWPTLTRYPNSFDVATSEHTYDLLVGHEEEAVEQVAAALKSHVDKKGGLLDDVHVTFLPDLGLTDDDFVVNCSFVGKNQVAEFAGTTRFSGATVRVERVEAVGTQPMNASDKQVPRTGDTRTMSSSSTTRTSRGGGMQRG